jgi:ABC-type proline/glycine betaine transport system permease subunit
MQVSWTTVGWWLIAIPIGVAVCAVLERFGNWGLGLRFWQRMPSWARVLLLVAIIAVGAVGFVLVAQYLGGRNDSVNA